MKLIPIREQSQTKSGPSKYTRLGAPLLAAFARSGDFRHRTIEASRRICESWDVPQNAAEAVGTPAPAARISDSILRYISIPILLSALAMCAACSRETPAAASKPSVTLDPDVFTADHPELFKTAKAELRQLPTQITANGVIAPDVNRTIHVTSLGSGRVIDLKVKLGDAVKKGQTLLVISSPDLASAFADFEKAKADEVLSRKALDRAQMLYDRGAIAAKDLEFAQDTEDKAKVDLETSDHRVRILGGDPARPSPLLELRAPIDGTIVEQNVAGAEGIKSLDNSPNLFTIANLGQVWVVCDVFENDLGDVHLDDSAEIRLNAFPDRVLKGRVADISRVLDPNTRSAKVRIVLPNPDGSLRTGMFAVATFRSRKLTDRIVVPATAIMRLHDKDWVFRKESPDQFRKISINADGLAPDGMQEIREGVKPGDELVTNALEFSTDVAEKRAGQ
ncbi:MAG TPA: efflux RND transporter periplasmic adaptor subunit [Candidatus Binatia bacterium]|nr:efflux RND transporter periplasmic adaptor subunit [Candidatus Binatia bacterium]